MHKNWADEATKMPSPQLCRNRNASRKGILMSGIIYLVGLVVVILAILSFFGLR
jgi:hypothetical protein